MARARGRRGGTGRRRAGRGTTKRPTRTRAPSTKATRRPPARSKRAPPGRRKRAAPARAPARHAPKRSVAVVRPVGPAAPHPAAPARTPTMPSITVQPDSPQWKAYAEIVQKVEMALGARLDEVHRRLDSEGFSGARFLEILMRIRNIYGIPEFYAGVVARTYPGYDTQDAEALGLRSYLRQRGATGP